MKVHHSIIQGSREWHEIKYRKVGGSTSKGLFVNSDTLMLELLAEHTEEFQLEDDSYVSDAMQRGIDLEPLHRSEMEKYIGVKLIQPGWLQSDEVPILGVSPDGISEDFTISWEGKCPAAKRHIETAHTKQIPSDNIHQCLHYFTVNPALERHYFSSFRPESEFPLVPFMITRDSLIDLGTKAKPNVKKVSEWVLIATASGLELEANIEVALINLRKI
jgi:predicted phage-related endonuclease